MNKAIKKTIEIILKIILCFSFILLCAEQPDGSTCLPLDLACVVVLVTSAKILDKMGAFDKEELI